MIYTHCIWDFNGTILDDVDLGIYCVNILLKERGLAEIPSKEVYREKFDFPVIDYYKAVGFDFSNEPYEKVANEWVALYKNNISMSHLCDGVVEALEYFKEKGVEQNIISASEKQMLIDHLSTLRVDSYFSQVFGIDNIYANSKLSLAKLWRENNPDARPMFIGDTVHDIETAQLLGADCFVVCSGHQCRERFEGFDVKIFDDFYELLNYFKKNL